MDGQVGVGGGLALHESQAADLGGVVGILDHLHQSGRTGIVNDGGRSIGRPRHREELGSEPQ